MKIILILIIIILLIFILFKKKRELFINTDIITNIFSKGFIRVDQDKVKYNKNNVTYGEISNEGIKILSNLTQNKNLFIDLGCGSGRSLAYAINNGFNKAKGIELVLERVNYGRKHIELLPLNMKKDIEIDQGDILELNKDYFSGANVIWLSNLLFPISINDKIFKFLSDSIDKDTIVALSRESNEMYDLKFVKEIKLPMSWKSESIVKIYKKI